MMAEAKGEQAKKCSRSLVRHSPASHNHNPPHNALLLLKALKRVQWGVEVMRIESSRLENACGRGGGKGVQSQV